MLDTDIWNFPWTLLSKQVFDHLVVIPHCIDQIIYMSMYMSMHVECLICTSNIPGYINFYYLSPIFQLEELVLVSYRSSIDVTKNRCFVKGNGPKRGPSGLGKCLHSSADGLVNQSKHIWLINYCTYIYILYNHNTYSINYMYVIHIIDIICIF